jgi:hypothetical protein
MDPGARRAGAHAGRARAGPRAHGGDLNSPTMSKWPRYRVLALWLLEERYEADGWLEIRTRGPDLRWWESRCKVVRWNHHDRTGSMPIPVRVELTGGGELSGTAYVDQAFHLWGDEADLKIHGTEQGFKLRELGPIDYVVPRGEALKQTLFFPGRVLVFLLVAVGSIILLTLFLALVFAPEIFPPARPGF